MTIFQPVDGGIIYFCHGSRGENTLVYKPKYRPDFRDHRTLPKRKLSRRELRRLGLIAKSNGTGLLSWRRAAFAVVALAAVFGGYLIGANLHRSATDQAVLSPTEPLATPWYQEQPQTPSFLIKDENGLPAYEEDLPDDTYVARAPEWELVVASPSLGVSLSSPPLVDADQAWRKYAVAAPDPAGRPLVAILIDDMGVDQARSIRMAALPGPLTLAYLPYSRGLADQTNAARASGHELMVHVSMEPSGGAADPGPRVLTLGDSSEILRANLTWALGQFDGYVGINNHMGSRFTTDTAAMGVVLAEIAKRGLLFVDSRTTSQTVGAQVARELGVPHIQRNLFLDNENTQQAVSDQLAKLEAMAQTNGYALAIGHPRQGTLDALEPWLASLRAKGFALVPVSHLVARTIATTQSRATTAQ